MFFKELKSIINEKKTLNEFSNILNLHPVENNFNRFKSVYKYFIREKKWITFQNDLHSPLKDCIAILTEGNTYVHIIGGEDDKKAIVSTHMKTKMRIIDW
ncbi:hypothetical protein RFI_20801 [Reticulomyxa filosa]|uniref:Uncharacterized protein n=1 Tax=Reticulomyxa filosa TaxID=46433 RepID=X6MRA9_RETFI|nr:hypothetical protein RFI_20801 [Reticulomyxa filosa]|eukprot:ETO16538.1 hypothetical protein RFI_20801 [Reticulomyxa filosa]